MKMFLDTANLDELRKGARWGIVDGVTSATAKLSKEGIRVTAPFKVLDSLFNHPLTDKRLAQFLKDWEKTFPKDPPDR